MRCSVGTKLRKTTASIQQKKGGEIQYMRILAIITLAAMAIGLGACASKPASAPMTSTTTSSK
jgi:hypothetical protein